MITRVAVGKKAWDLEYIRSTIIYRNPSSIFIQDAADNMMIR